MKEIIFVICGLILTCPILPGQGSWQKSAGINKLSTNTFIDLSGRCFAGTADSGVYISDDQGISWTEANNGIPFTGPLRSATSFSASNTVLYAAFGHALGGGIYATFDEGASWTGTTFPTGATDIIADDSVISASTGSANFIYARSADHGATWDITTSLFSEYRFNYKKSAGIWYATSLSQGLVFSPDTGITWQSLGFAGTFCFDYFFLDAMTVVSTPDGIYQSDDNGVVWTPANTSGLMADASRIRCFATSGNTVYAASDTAVYSSVLNGSGLTPWQKLPLAGLPALDPVHIIGPIHCTGTVLVLGTCDLSAAGTASQEKGMGIWYYQESTTFFPRVEGQENTIHIYPNPATDRITIVLPRTGIRLELYDIFGKLRNCYMISPHKDFTGLDISSWPKGIYIVKAELPDGSISVARFVKQ